jgi:hypothetical protein
MTIGTIAIIVGVVLLLLLKILFKNKEFHGVEHADLLKEEPEFDRTWSFLPSNIFHRSDDD